MVELESFFMIVNAVSHQYMYIIFMKNKQCLEMFEKVLGLKYQIFKHF